MLQQSDYNENYYNDGGDVGGYDVYNENSASTETAVQLAQKFIDKLAENGIDIIGKKVLDIGCGYGFLIKYLVEKGVDAYGMDWSNYAVSQVPLEIQDRIIVGDIKLDADFQRVKTLAGLTKKNDKFDLIIDQDVIVCLANDTEAQTFCTLARKYGNFVIHYLENSPHISRWYIYHTMDEWKALIGNSPKEKWYSRFTWIE